MAHENGTPRLEAVTLSDQGDTPKVHLTAHLEIGNGQLWIRPEGYGTKEMPNGEGAPICLEIYNGELRLHIWTDIKDADPKIISLSGAREALRGPERGACRRCGSPLDPDGFCQDETCPHSDWPQAVDTFAMGDQTHQEIEDRFDTIRRRKGRRILAQFQPQAWVRDYAVDADPEGETEFDVTAEILAMGRSKALALVDGDTTDWLARTAAAPAWIRDWGGPFEVYVKDSINEYLGEEE